ncbi:MAG: peptidoglycan recognition protein family protein [Candidatus Sumerlaeaceae bacterium]
MADTPPDGKGAASATSEVLKLEIHRHSSWSEIPPKGVDAEGMRMNLAPGDSLQFRDMSLSVTQMMAAETSGAREQVNITLKQGGTTETRTLGEGAAFNWKGYHVSIVAIYAKKGDLGFGLTVIEVATVQSLPKEVAQSDKANGPEYRLRVKHHIDKLTLHHSATTHLAGDDLTTKLRNMQIWGEKDRNWFDVPYHFFIDIDGGIFEARNFHYMGDTNTRYDPRGHFLINCFGNYSKVEPNKKQLESIAKLMAWAAAEFRINPLKIYGHRDLAQTSCPGDNLYKVVEDGTLKKMVEAILANGKPELVWLEEKRAPANPHQE